MKAISLFSGVGGFELGFDRAGIDTVLQVEIDETCRAVLERHWPEVERIADVQELRVAGGDGRYQSQRPCSGTQRTADTYDLVFGGFPCQDLSVAGKRAGLGGERSGLWFEFERVLSELRPRWVVIENVPGLLHSPPNAPGRDFAIILDALAELGFGGVAWAVLDAQHFGVPQRRRRVFIVGGPSRAGVQAVLSLCESCGGNPDSGAPPGEGTASGSVGFAGGTSADGCDGDGQGEGRGCPNIALSFEWQAGTDDISLVDPAQGLTTQRHPAVLAASLRSRSSNPGVNMPGRGGEDDENLVVKRRGGHGYTKPSHISPTLEAEASESHQGGPMNTPLLLSQVRRLTPLECERLQGWPDDWTRWRADGSEISDSARYRMIGNGVASPVAEWVGHRLVAVDGAQT